MRLLAGAALAFAMLFADPANASPLDDAVQEHRAIVDPKSTTAAREEAQYALAVRLHRLRFVQASYAVFSAIADKPEHAAFERTLPWLARLETDLPEPADVDERIAKYDDRAIQAFHLEFHRARHLFKTNRFEEALRWIAKVPRDSGGYQKAWFLGGVAHVHLKRAPEAIQAFKRAAAAEETNDAYDYDRRVDLALISIARTYYSAKEYATALEYFRRVDETGEIWLDALYEQSWALFMTGDHAKALGNLFVLRTEWLDSQWYPEADLLKSLVYVANCQYDDARTLAAAFQQRYAPIAAELRALRLDDDESAYRLTRDVRNGNASISPRARMAVVTALSDRELLRHLQYVVVIEDEKKRFLRTPASFQESKLGGDVKDALDLARDLAIRNTGRLARARIRRTVSELGRLLADNATLLATPRPDVGVRMPASTDKNVVRGDDEHVIWPFTGEYWPDEVGTYRQSIQSKCR
jgi:tetratricopeptide (TPR) repeat protein